MGNNHSNEISIQYEGEWDLQWIFRQDLYWSKLQEITNRMQAIYQETDNNKHYTVFDTKFRPPDKKWPWTFIIQGDDK